MPQRWSNRCRGKLGTSASGFEPYGVADTEQHFFVETNADNELKSVYWVQYEAYLPGKRYTYDYDDSPLRVTLGETEFFTDTAMVAFDPTIRNTLTVIRPE